MLPILKFRPVLMAKPWGGDGLWRTLKKGAATDERMGESWELSDRLEGETTVRGGPLEGARLSDLVTKDPAALLGEDLIPREPGESFPLLYKFISAREKLSVQVHPGVGSSRGEAKTECWYIVDAQPGAELIVGVRPVVTEEKSEGDPAETLERTRALTLACLKSAECENALQRLPARRGDVFQIPAGAVHAITEGLLIYELQQNSDTTFRLYDWGRVDASGKSRALHLEEAAQVADLEAREGYKIPPLRVEGGTHHEDFLVACPYYALVKWSGIQVGAEISTQGRFRVLTVVSGAVTLTAPGQDSDSASLKLGLGETALVPASLKSVIFESIDPATEVLVSFVPDLERDVRAPLRTAGHAPEAIERLSGPKIPEA